MTTVSKLLLPLIQANLRVSLSQVGAPQEVIKAVDSLTAVNVKEAANMVSVYILSVVQTNTAEQHKSS